MKAPNNKNPVSFDDYAERYDESLNRALAISGEDKLYFASQRIQRLGEIFSSRGHQIHNILDFGCGTGTAAPILRNVIGARKIVGLDPSSESIRMARENHDDAMFSFIESKDYSPMGDFDAAHCNGVFHHIPRPERLEAAQSVLKSLRPGGLFALWENNPYNPGTVYVMAECEFDRDAVTLTPPESRKLLRTAGFEILQTEYLFFFPKFLGVFRPLEKYLRRLPLGAQYLVLARRPLAA